MQNARTVVRAVMYGGAARAQPLSSCRRWRALVVAVVLRTA